MRIKNLRAMKLPEFSLLIEKGIVNCEQREVKKTYEIEFDNEENQFINVYIMQENKNRFTHIMFADTRTHQRVLSEPISIILPWESYESIDLW